MKGAAAQFGNGCDAIRLLLNIARPLRLSLFGIRSDYRRSNAPAIKRKRYQTEEALEVSDLFRRALRPSVEIELLAIANGVIKPLDIGSPPFSC